MPLVFVSTLYYITEHLHPNPSMPPLPMSEMWRIYVFPYYHLWFLQAIMVIFVAIAVLETAHVLDTPWRAVIALAVTLVLPLYFAVQNDWFSITGLVRLLPFFILGLSVNRFRHLLQHPSLPWIVTGVFVIAMGKHWLGVLGLVGQPVPRVTPMATLISVSAVLAAWYWVPRAQLLERLGNFSFPVFAYHVFFVAIMREVLNVLGLGDRFVIFFVCFACGIAGPIVMSNIVERISLGRRLVLGRA